MRNWRAILIGLALSPFFIVACGDDETTEPTDPLIGTWVLAQMRVNGTTVNPDDYFDVLIKLTFDSDGTGRLWEEDYGHLEPECPWPFIWHTAGSTLYLQASGEDEGVGNFSVSGSTLVISFTDPDDGTRWEYEYARQ
ncbi:MAG: hypothetical protein JXA57_18175 [Armatimonadetes bacterium]|nr:hypothetical protein [Armatimonadota bacterium]